MNFMIRDVDPEKDLATLEQLNAIIENSPLLDRVAEALNRDGPNAITIDIRKLEKDAGLERYWRNPTSLDDIAPGQQGALFLMALEADYTRVTPNRLAVFRHALQALPETEVDLRTEMQQFLTRLKEAAPLPAHWRPASQPPASGGPTGGTEPQ
jgi:hypothetical protein